MTDLRALARGRPCMVRIPGVCNYNLETTVLAHFRMAGLCGVGMKPPDVIGAWACSACHDVIDGRRSPGSFSRNELRLAHLEGVVRTQNELIRMGFEFTQGATTT